MCQTYQDTPRAGRSFIVLILSFFWPQIHHAIAPQRNIQHSGVALWECWGRSVGIGCPSMTARLWCITAPSLGATTSPQRLRVSAGTGSVHSRRQSLTARSLRPFPPPGCTGAQPSLSTSWKWPTLISTCAVTSGQHTFSAEGWVSGWGASHPDA